VRRRAGARRAGPRRAVDWIPMVHDERDVQDALVTIALTDEVDIELKDGKWTVERCVGQVLFQKLSQTAPGPTALSSFAEVSMGIIVLQEDALNGVLAVNPRIQDDLEMPWLWVRHLMVGGGTSNGGGGLNAQGFVFNPWVEYDFKVRRKMTEREILAMIIVATPWDGAQTNDVPPLFSYDFKIRHRTLVKMGGP